MGRSGESLNQMLEHVTQFKSVRDLKITGGWQPVKKSQTYQVKGQRRPIGRVKKEEALKSTK